MNDNNGGAIERDARSIITPFRTWNARCTHTLTLTGWSCKLDLHSDGVEA